MLLERLVSSLVRQVYLNPAVFNTRDVLGYPGRIKTKEKLIVPDGRKLRNLGTLHASTYTVLAYRSTL